jgi:hypothetical protein
MTNGHLPADVKCTSVLRRVPPLAEARFRSECGEEGDVCAFELPIDAFPVTVEAPTGRVMAIVPGDVFLATPGHRQSTKWVDGKIPAGGLTPGGHYWVLAECGLVGELVGNSPSEKDHLGRVKYLGKVYGERGKGLNMRQFTVPGPAGPNRNMALYLVLGTSGDSGKTTAGLAVLRALRMQGYATITALKATGSPLLEEISRYRDFGAAQAFDCVDFGMPATDPSGRDGISKVFDTMLDYCLSLPADALVVECGGDLFGANVPDFLKCLRLRRPDPKIVLAATDAIGALGATRVLRDMGLAISLITGPCTDTPTFRGRTEALCGVPALNLLRRPSEGGNRIFEDSLDRRRSPVRGRTSGLRNPADQGAGSRRRT